MPRNKTDSPLAKKYGQKRVVMARNLVQAKLGIKLGSEKEKDKIPWAIVGKIVQDEVKGHKYVKEKDIRDAQQNFKKHGPEPSMRRYFKASKKRIVKKKVSRETRLSKRK